MINAAMCFLKKDGQTLFLYRNRGEKDIHNGWHVPPGGKTERGETGATAVIREFFEETGLTLINPKLRAIVTFYNEGRLMGGKESPEDWCVEIYEATDFTGNLIEEHPLAKPIWISDSELGKLKMRPGDRKVFELLKKGGVFEVLVQYSKEELIRFEEKRVD